MGNIYSTVRFGTVLPCSKILIIIPPIPTFATVAARRDNSLASYRCVRRIDYFSTGINSNLIPGRHQVTRLAAYR